MDEKQIWSAAFAFSVLDQFVKWWVLTRTSARAAVVNAGGLGGLGTSSPSLIIVLSLIALIALVLAYQRIKHVQQRFALVLLITGLALHTLDRFFRGGAVDYINMPPFPLFNLADILMLVGVIWLLILITNVQRTKSH